MLWESICGMRIEKENVHWKTSGCDDGSRFGVHEPVGPGSCELCDRRVVGQRTCETCRIDLWRQYSLGKTCWQKYRRSGDGADLFFSCGSAVAGGNRRDPARCTGAVG